MKLSLKKQKLKLRLKKITLSKDTSLEDTADSLSPRESPYTTKTPPYGAFNQTTFHRIRDKLYMSGYHSAKDLNALKNEGITHVINLTSSHCANLHEGSLSYSNFELADNSNFDLQPHLQRIVGTIKAKMEGGEKVLVHCKMGVSRAPSIVIAYLILEEKMGYERAFGQVFKVNRKIAPNFGYLMQLQRL
jgi:protein tyrosine phosphatase (PTP) superfamily phosphohydrolase (DUF442 family)